MKYLSILSLLPLAFAPSPARAVPEPVLVSTADRPTDDEINAKVLAAIQADDTLRYHVGNIQVSTSGGIVTLTGTVPRDAIRMRLSQVAKGASGDFRVVNLVKVNANG